MSADIGIGSATALGTRNVTVTNPDGQSDTLSGALAIISPYFEEIGVTAGVDDDARTMGVAWADYDGDDDQDIFAANQDDPSRLYRNGGGLSFTDVAAAAGVAQEAGAPAIAWADYDNDGDLDAFLVGDHTADDHYLYQNNGDGTFTDVKATMGLAFSGDPEGAAWADYDRDGDVDLFVGIVDQSSALFRNDGSTFTEVAAIAGVTASISGGSGAAWGDYDGDGWPDLFVVTPGYVLYHNEGDGTFTEVSGAAGLNGYANGAPAWGDYDNDGDLDLFVTTYDQYEPNGLYRNNGSGTFTHVSAVAGVNRFGYARGAAWADYDNDGWLDVFVSDQRGPDKLYHNEGNGTFSDGNLAARLDGGWQSSGAAWGDYDGDGYLDLYVGREWEPNLFYHNMLAGRGGHWLHVKLVGTLSNVSGISARVRVVGGSLSQIREVSGGSGFYSQDSLPVEFGLGGYTGTVGVEVTWPSGVVDTLPGVTTDQVITIVESTGRLHDLAMVNVAPDGEWPIDIPFQPVATLRNLGYQAESGVPVACEIEHGGSQVYTHTLASGSIPPAAWTTLLYPSFTPHATGLYTLTCQSYLTGDEEPLNDWMTRTITVTQQIADVWTKDNPGDDGDTPSGYENWYMSPDLWVRHQPDGGLVHQDPVAGITNTVYVRLRNRGNAPVYTGTVSVYWIEPSLGVRCGDWALIGVIPFANLMPGEQRIVSAPWIPTRTGHTCLQDVVDSPQDPYDRGLECAPQWVPWDNNVEWRNVNVYSSPRTGLFGALRTLDVKEAEVQLVNIYDRAYDVDVIVERMTFPTTGTITIKLPGYLFDRWLSHGKRWGEGIEVLTATKEIRVTGAVSATIGAVPMAAQEEAAVGLHFEGPAGLAFEMAIRERIDGITTGGVAYQWIIPDTTPPSVESVSPSSGATEVAVDTPIVIAFDEEIGPLSLKLTLDPALGITTTWNEAGTVVTATHAGLAMGTAYTVTVTANDAAGNSMAAPTSWTFATEKYRIYLPPILRQ